MAAISTTPANVHLHDEVVQTDKRLFGETIAASDACYFNDTTQKWMLLDANTEHDDTVQFGVCLVGAATDSYGVIVTKGPMDIGGTLTSATAYIAGTTAGDIHPASDFSGFSSAWQYHLGYATAADKLYVNPFKTGAAVA